MSPHPRHPAVPTSSRAPLARRGGAYLLVLGSTTLLTVLGLAAIAVARIEREVAADLIIANEARLAAAAGLELAVASVEAGSAARGLITTPLFYNAEMGSALLTINALDPTDADLQDSEFDPIRFEVVAKCDALTFETAAQFNPVFANADQLAFGVSAGGNITFSGATAFSSTGFHSSGNVSASSSSTVTGTVQATGSIGGSTYVGSQTAGVASLKSIDPTVFTRWVAQGTRITFASIPSKTIERAVLGPNTNPYGTANAAGIYFIDCGGQDIVIKNARIRGTLILLNTGAGSVMSESVSMEPASTGTPTLLVLGQMTFQCSGSDLSEAVQSMNFNPAGVPYEGSTDADTTDSYASVISGLIYVTDDIEVKGTTTFDGLLMVGGDLRVTGTLTVWHQAPASTPMGFRTFTSWAIDAGTLERTVE